MQQEKRKNPGKQDIQSLWEDFKRYYICIIRLVEGGEREQKNI